MDPKNRLKVILSLVATLLGLILFLAVGAHFRTTAPDTLPSDPACDISQSACTATNDAQTIELAILTRPVTSMVPLTFDLTLSNVEADQVIIDLQGAEMYMGLHRTELTPSTEPGHWSGSLTLALCTSGEMRWRTQVIARQGETETRANFEFSAR